MKDIKIQKVKLNLNKKTEEVVEVSSKKTLDIFSVIFFGFMTTSVICYVFFISTSIFYAVKAGQYDYKTEKISNSYSLSLVENVGIKTYSERISYIDTDSETAITLK